MIIILHILWAYVKDSLSHYFYRKTSDQCVQFDSSTEEKLDHILHIVSDLDLSSNKLTVLTSKGVVNPGKEMYAESSDEDDGFVMSSPADELVLKNTAAASYEQTENSTAKSDNFHGPKPLYPAVRNTTTNVFLGRGRGQMRPHPLMQAYGVPSRPNHASTHTRPINPRTPYCPLPNHSDRPSHNQDSYHSGSYSESTQETSSHTLTSHPTPGNQATKINSGQDHQKEYPLLTQKTSRKSSKSTKMAKQEDNTDKQRNSCVTDNIGTHHSKVSESWLTKTLQKASLSQSSLTEMKKMLLSIETVWFDDCQKDKSQSLTMIKGCFSQSSHPYLLLIYFIEHCRDHNSGKTSSICFNFMKEFVTWLKKNKDKDLSGLLTDEIKAHALEACTRYNTSLLNMAVTAFQLDKSGKENMLPQVKAYLEKKKYNEAAVITGKLGLQDHFTIEQIALPLVLQDKVNVLETYAYGNPTQQKLLVQMLDNLVDKETVIDDIISKSGVPNPKREKLNKKTLSKLAARLMKLYDISQDLCPNIAKARGVGALRYLLYRKFIEGRMGAGSWEELVQNATGDSQYLKEQLVEQLVCYNELIEAVKWARYFQLSDEMVPEVVAVKRRTMEQEPDEPQRNDGGENWDEECYSEAEIAAHYCSLELPEDHITVVDTKDKYHACLSTLTKPGTMIGIDAEWKPSFGSQVQKIALIQMATYDHIFLIDIRTLNTILTEDDWQLMVTSVFCNKDLIKLGYGLDSDFKMFVKTFPFLEKTLATMQRVVDLERLAQLVLDKVVNIMPETETNSDEEVPNEDENDSGINFKFQKVEERGLSELVRQCFGKALNKSEQMSDWERRPLRQPQIIYAALDAFILLKVRDKLVKTAKDQNLNINIEPPTSMRWMKQSKNDKKKAKARGQKLKHRLPKQLPQAASKPSPYQGVPHMVPGNLRVVVDSMLQGLGKQLRSCGVDVHILEKCDSHDKTIEVCQQESRIILSSGTPFQRIFGIVGDRMCYNVQTATAREQVVEVLQYFNVKVTEGDIFSRCQLCNGNEYLQVPCSVFKEQWMKAKTMSKQEKQSYNLDLSHGIEWSTMTVAGNNVPLQLDALPEPMFDKVEKFFICQNCGKIFWEGSHFVKVCDQFSHVLDMNSSGTNVYTT